MDATIKSTGTITPADPHLAKPTREQAEHAVRTLIAWAGDDPNREGVLDTPARVVRAYEELFAGYATDPKEVLEKTFKEVGGYDDIVLMRNIPFYAHCEHHMVPFFGHVHIAYLPHDGVVGLSKLARLTDVFAKRLQTQENMTAQIIDAINEHLNPRGAAVMVEAEHMCMSMRGVHKQGVTTLTHRFTGTFAEEQAERDRFFAAVNR